MVTPHNSGSSLLTWLSSLLIITSYFLVLYLSKCASTLWYLSLLCYWAMHCGAYRGCFCLSHLLLSSKSYSTVLTILNPGANCLAIPYLPAIWGKYGGEEKRLWLKK